MRAAGIDVGAAAVHVAVVDDGAVVLARSFPADELGAVVAMCAGAVRVGVDAPAAPSVGAHVADPAWSGSAKFRSARCSEIAAGEQLGVWVPWVTPVGLEACPPWMRTGFAVWSALAAAGLAAVEVFPGGSFWLLHGRRWPPKKSTAAGRAWRASVLGVPPSWSHDLLDAAMAAVVAASSTPVVARHPGTGCDGSALWFPPAPTPASVPPPRRACTSA
ncbi:MAG TPA: DUF429 domain-containing protein [Acidimicrobiales bacterium]|nr:DUF429 domain-containing protein [Acidimicrobiales bacterium]